MKPPGRWPHRLDRVWPKTGEIIWTSKFQAAILVNRTDELHMALSPPSFVLKRAAVACGVVYSLEERRQNIPVERGNAGGARGTCRK